MSQPYPWAHDQGQGLQGCRPKGKSRVTFHAPGNAKECEGMNPHTPKELPLWAIVGVKTQWIEGFLILLKGY